MYKNVAVLAALLLAFQLNAQREKVSEIEIGKHMPLQSIKGISYYPEKNLNLSQLHGKWLILDFWTVNCASCIESFPKMSELRKNLRDKVEVILIGDLDKSNKVRDVYKRFQQKFNLDLPVFFDSLLLRRFKVRGCPYIVIIDDKGIVRAITYSIHESEMNTFLAGQTPVLPATWNGEQEAQNQALYDYHKPLLINGNGGHDTDFLFRSLLTNYKSEIVPSFDDYISYKNKNQLQEIGVELEWLYHLAYGDTAVSIQPRDYREEGKNSFGKWWPRPLLEFPDSGNFRPNYMTGENLFNYSLIIPPDQANTLVLQEMLQTQLKSIFHYEVRIEQRKMPYWKLILIGDSASLLTHKVEPKFNWSPVNVHVENMPLAEIVSAIWYYNQLSIFEDETGIKGNVDFSLDCIMSDFEEIKAALEKKGLQLVKGEKEMNVIVISKPKAE